MAPTCSSSGWSPCTSRWLLLSWIWSPSSLTTTRSSKIAAAIPPPALVVRLLEHCDWVDDDDEVAVFILAQLLACCCWYLRPLFALAAEDDDNEEEVRDSFNCSRREKVRSQTQRCSCSSKSMKFAWVLRITQDCPPADTWKNNRSRN